MGNPHLKLKQNSIIVDGFYFNISMAIFQEQSVNHFNWPENSIVPKVAAHIKQCGYEYITDTVFCFDDFILNERDRSDLKQWIKQLRSIVLEPSLELPKDWKPLIENA